MINIQCPDTPLFRHAALDFLASNRQALDLNFYETQENVAATENKIVADDFFNESCVADDDLEDTLPIGTDFICPVTGERLDKEGGYPWDERIHSSKKTKLAKGGSWKPLRGVDVKEPGLKEQIEKEFDLRRSKTEPKIELGRNEFPQSTAFVDGAGRATSKIAPPAPPALKPVSLFEMPDKPSFTDIISFTTQRLSINPHYQAGIDSVLAQFQITDISKLMGQSPDRVQSFGQWLVYEWANIDG